MNVALSNKTGNLHFFDVHACMAKLEYCKCGLIILKYLAFFLGTFIIYSWLLDWLLSLLYLIHYRYKIKKCMMINLCHVNQFSNVDRLSIDQADYLASAGFLWFSCLDIHFYLRETEVILGT